MRAAVYLFALRNRISTLGMSHLAHIPQKTAWYLLLRLGYACRPRRDDRKFRGKIIADVCYLDGLNKWRRLREKIPARQGVGLRAMCVMIQIPCAENGDELLVRALPVGRRRLLSVRQCVVNNVAFGVTVYTDQGKEFQGLAKKFRHLTVNHLRQEYARFEDGPGGGEKVTTNNAEGMIAAFKIKLRSHRWVSPEHFEYYLQLYVTAMNQGVVAEDIWTRVSEFFIRALRPSGALSLKSVLSKKARENMAKRKRAALAKRPTIAVLRMQHIRAAEAQARKWSSR